MYTNILFCVTNKPLATSGDCSMPLTFLFPSSDYNGTNNPCKNGYSQELLDIFKTY